MVKKVGKLQKKLIITKNVSISLLTIFIMIFSLVFLCFINDCNVSGSSFYTPEDLDGDGWNNDIEIAYGKDPEDSEDFPLDTDGDKIPDENSIDEVYKGDTDDDNDWLSDEIETALGSNPKKFGDIKFLEIEGTTYCLVDTNENAKFDLLYNTLTEIKTKTKNQDGATLLDIDGDGSWDYSYDQGSLGAYKESYEIPWLYVILAIIAIVLITVFILFKKGILYLYEEEYIEE